MCFAVFVYVCVFKYVLFVYCVSLRCAVCLCVFKYVLFVYVCVCVFK